MLLLGQLRGRTALDRSKESASMVLGGRQGRGHGHRPIGRLG